MQTVTAQNTFPSQVTVSAANCDLKYPLFSDRLRLIMGGESLRGYAQKIGISDGALRAYLANSSEPSMKILVLLAKEAGVSIDWLATGEGEIRPSEAYSRTSQHSVQEPAPLVRAKQSAEDKMDAWDSFALVPVYDVQASAGHGSLVESELQTGQLAFKKSWLREKGLQIGHLAIITAKGDSMETTIYDGDTLLVDTRVDRIIDDSIYIVQADHHLIVKRLQQDFDGSVFVISDNPRYEKRHLNPEQAKNLKIAGRVCWYGHEI